MGLDQYFLMQKKGTAESVIGNGEEVGYFRKAWWIHHLVEEVVGEVENCKPVRLLEADIDAIWNGIPGALKGIEDEREQEFIYYSQPWEDLAVALLRVKLAIHNGEQAWYYADW